MLSFWTIGIKFIWVSYSFLILNRIQVKCNMKQMTFLYLDSLVIKRRMMSSYTLTKILLLSTMAIRWAYRHVAYFLLLTLSQIIEVGIRNQREILLPSETKVLNIDFTYSVNWIPTNVPYNSRYKNYITFFEHKVRDSIKDLFFCLIVPHSFFIRLVCFL